MTRFISISVLKTWAVNHRQPTEKAKLDDPPMKAEKVSQAIGYNAAMRDLSMFLNEVANKKPEEGQRRATEGTEQAPEQDGVEDRG